MRLDFAHQKRDKTICKKSSSVAMSVSDQIIRLGDFRRCCVGILRDVPEIKISVAQKNTNDTKKQTGELLFTIAFYYDHHYNLYNVP